MLKRIPQKPMIFLILILVTGSILAGCAPTQATPTQAPAAVEPTSAAVPGWQEISVEQAAEKRDAGAWMLDVREPSEWAEAHIPGATLIPLGELAQRVSEAPKDQEIVVYCRSGNRSKAGADILTKAGYTNVSSMAGGINQWSAAGYPTESGN